MIAAMPASSRRSASSARAKVGGFGPAFGGDHAGLGVDADGDPAGEFSRRLAHQSGVFGRGAAEDDAGDAGCEPGFDAGQVADAAAELHREC